MRRGSAVMSDAPSNRRRILLVRHAAVADRYAELCYGRSDIELSDEGHLRTAALAEELSCLPITHLFHSPLARSAAIAERIVLGEGISRQVSAALAEIDFGQWELRPWEQIYAEVPDALDRMIAEPDTYAAPGGETLSAVRQRVLGWYESLPERGRIVAVTHGGPIAVLRGTLAGLPVDRWFTLVPEHGEIVEIEPGTAGSM
jgi:broad specificity phosphatase PhoE